MKQIVSVGIDVSKGKSTVCAMIHPNTIIKESFEVLHTVEEMSMLADYIGSLDGEIRIVMESTGHYHLPVAQFLYQKGFFVCVENAYIIRQFSRIMLHGAKTDPLDAKKLAKYGLAYWSELKPYKFHPSCYTELSLLSKQYQTYIKLLIAAKQNVIHLMDEMLPGFKEALDTASSVQFSKVKYVDFAKEFYHVDMIKSMGKAWEKKFFERIISNGVKKKDTVSNQKRQTSFFTWRKTVSLHYQQSSLQPDSVWK